MGEVYKNQTKAQVTNVIVNPTNPQQAASPLRESTSFRVNLGELAGLTTGSSIEFKLFEKSFIGISEVIA